ncbi:MAG: ATP-binding cassette domain-containing protein [Bdellovibrionaceae bacterium]|nr:ATP-binding cassette domain-containing protein [Pseudobdellovibrionaceae bacterium]
MTSPKIEKLRFENVSFKFDGQDPVFENVDFDFPMNQMVWVKAEHGSGRSTLLQILAALQMPTKGNYLINDANVGEMSFEEFLPYRLAIGYGFDMGGLIHNRTLFENLILPLNYHKVLSPQEAGERVTHYMREFNLTKYKDQRPSFMPGGAKKLACLLRAVILHPQMVLLDDPTVGLPQDTALKFFDLLETLRKEGSLKHAFVSSFDEKFMGLIENTEIFIEGGLLHALPEMDEKKVVSL